MTCPLAINSSVYEDVARDLQDGMTSEILDSRAIFELLLAHIVIKPGAILEPSADILKRIGMMREDSVDTCDNVTGHATADITWESTRAYFIPWELALASGLILWAVILVAASLPYRSCVVKNSVNQWLSFGADAGVVNVKGASTGVKPPQSENKFVLVNESKDEGCWWVSVVRADEDHGDHDRGGKRMAMVLGISRYI